MSTQKPLIIVTGASRGLGLAITDILLKKLNTRVVAISRSKTPELLNLASEDLEIIQCDVTDEAGFTAAITNTEQKYGTIDGLILNAAILEPFGLIGNDVPLSRWRAHFEVNFFSLVTAVRAALPALRKSERGGRIVFVSSTAATGSNASWGPYNAGKAAMNSLCRTLGEEEPRVISVAVEPGMVDTGMQEFIRSNKGDAIPEDLHKMFIDVHAEGKLVRPEDAGHVLAALAVRAPADYSGKFVSWDGDEYLDKEALNDNLGWKTPEGNLPWTAEVSLRAMDAAGIDIAVLSFPALHLGSVSEENRKAARGRNLYISDVVKTHPKRFGFFATLPFLDDTEGALKEIAFALDELHADGIGLSTSYGVGPRGTYIGHEKYEPIWAELDRRKAIVFLHGAQVEPASPPPDPTLVVPVADVPNETYKAAAHLVVTGRKRDYPNVKIILSHLGGSTLALAPRVAVGSNYLGCPLTPDEILADFKTFYYDTALSGYDSTLTAADKFVPREHLLFGTDFPAVSMEMSDWYKDNVERYYEDDQSKLQGIMYKNALKLFPRFQELIKD